MIISPLYIWLKAVLFLAFRPFAWIRLLKYQQTTAHVTAPPQRKNRVNLWRTSGGEFLNSVSKTYPWSIFLCIPLMSKAKLHTRHPPWPCQPETELQPTSANHPAGIMHLVDLRAKSRSSKAWIPPPQKWNAKKCCKTCLVWCCVLTCGGRVPILLSPVMGNFGNITPTSKVIISFGIWTAVPEQPAFTEGSINVCQKISKDTQESFQAQTSDCNYVIHLFQP